MLGSVARLFFQSSSSVRDIRKVINVGLSTNTQAIQCSDVQTIRGTTCIAPAASSVAIYGVLFIVHEVTAASQRHGLGVRENQRQAEDGAGWKLSAYR